MATHMILIADSGSTKTEWALTDGVKTLADISTQGINPFHQDAETIGNILRGELLAGMPDAKLAENVFFYGSGCRSEYVGLVAEMLAGSLPHACSIEVASDMLGAARALFGRGSGVACILGTGANSCVYDGTKITDNVPPLGYVLGDEGSGAVMGRNFINALLKRRLPGWLKDDFMRTFATSEHDIIRRVYREPMANKYLASFSKYIHAHLDEPQVRDIVVSGFRDFFRLNIAAYGSCGMKVGAVGSIACFFEAELRCAAQAEGFRTGRVCRTPMPGLLEFHSHGTAV